MTNNTDKKPSTQICEETKNPGVIGSDLKKQLAEMQTLVDHSRDILFRMSRNRVMEYASPSLGRVLGRSVKEWNSGLESFLTDNPNNKINLKKAKVLARKGQEIPTYELEMYHENGRTILLEIKEKPNFKDGEIESYIGVARDVTQLIQMEERLNKKSQQIKHDSELAAKIHRTLIPGNLETDHLSIAIDYLPMFPIGGDYANYKFYSEDYFIFVISDVTGHGVSASLIVNRMDSELERLAKSGHRPGRLLNKFNTFYVNNLYDTHMLVSIFCGSLNFKTMKLTYSNFGHPPPFLYKASQSNLISLPAQTSMLGLPTRIKGEIFEDSIDLELEDKIVLYTDGVIEAKGKDRKIFGYERLKNFIKKNGSSSNQEFNKKLILEVNDFASEGVDDDLCVFTVGIKK